MNRLWKNHCRTGTGLAAALALSGAARASAAPPAEGYLGVIFVREAVDVAAEQAGTVREVPIRLGDRVAAGDALVVLESEELERALEQARASLAAARAEATKAVAELEEVTRLVERRKDSEWAFTEEELASLDSRRKVAEAERDLMESRVAERNAAAREAERRVRSLHVLAPFDGSVAACTHEAGARVAAGTKLVRLIGDGDLWVRFAAPADEVAALEVGSGVGVVVDGGEAIGTGEVRHVAPEVDSATGLVFAEAVLRLEEDARQPRSGAVVRVRP